MFFQTKIIPVGFLVINNIAEDLVLLRPGFVILTQVFVEVKDGSMEFCLKQLFNYLQCVGVD